MQKRLQPTTAESWHALYLWKKAKDYRPKCLDCDNGREMIRTRDGYYCLHCKTERNINMTYVED